MIKQGKTMNNETAYDHPQGGKLSRMGRILMDKAVTTKDDALSLVLSRVGDELTRYGAPGGARNIEELVKRCKLPQEKILKLMKWAESQKDVLDKVKNPPDNPDMDKPGHEEEESIRYESLEESVGKEITEDEFERLAEKQDACYHKVKSRYKVWPSAYASGALVQCRKKGAKNWGNKSKK